jgi:hypothetical protein
VIHGRWRCFHSILISIDPEFYCCIHVYTLLGYVVREIVPVEKAGV